MQRIPLLLVAAGFVFCYLSVPFMGIDLLIDAVGFLLVFNGLNALKKLKVLLGFVPPVALGLVAVSAAQLFATGGLGTGLAAARCVAEIALFWLLALGLYRHRVGLVRYSGLVAASIAAASSVLALLPLFLHTAAATALASVALAGHLLFAAWCVLAAMKQG